MDGHAELNDGQLVARVRAGEREAFGPLLQRHDASLTRLCQRLLGPTHEAQDVAQEATLQAYLELHRLQEPARFGAWLHAIAANLARMTLRRRRTVSLDAVADVDVFAALGAASAPSPEEAALAREIHDQVMRALAELSTVYRDAVVRFYLEEYRYAELAELLGVPVSTVKGRLFEGRAIASKIP